MRRATYYVVALLLVGAARAGAFELSLPDPELRLSVPGIPDIAVQERAGAQGDATRLLAGSNATYAVEVELSRQTSEMSPRVCAGLVLRALLARPGMPNRDNVYRAPLDADTFLVIYSLGDGEQARLHAHLISSAGTTHCASAHFLRRPKPGEDVDDWRTTFTSARMASRRGG